MNKSELEKLAEKAPETYAHEILSHGFMEYQNENNLIESVKKQIIKERIAKGDKAYLKYADYVTSEIPDRIHPKIYNENKERLNELFKQEFMFWARKNKHPEKLLELGWQTYLDD
jgi:hypothetical protein